MGFFGKKRGVVDFTKDKARHSPQGREESFETGEVVDLSSQSHPTGSPPSTTTGNSFGFLGDLAGASNTASSPGPVTSGLRDARDPKRERMKAAFNQMKFKVEDTEYKVNDLVERIREMDRRIKELEGEKRY